MSAWMAVAGIVTVALVFCAFAALMGAIFALVGLEDTRAAVVCGAVALTLTGFAVTAAYLAPTVAAG